MAKKNKKDKQPTVDFEQLESENWSPFDKNAKDREYTKPKVDPKSLEAEISEPTFRMPDLDSLEMESDPTGGSSKKEQPTNKESQKSESSNENKFNPEYHELSDKDKTIGAEMMADVALDGYSKLGTALGKFAEISEVGLEREIADGKIDPNLQMPIDQNGNYAPIRMWVSEYNKEAKEAFETDKEFIDKVKPPLIRVLKKRGVGMTDEQLLAYHFGTDLVQKGATLFALKKNSNMLLGEMRAQTEYMRQGASPTPPNGSTNNDTPPPKNSLDGDGSPSPSPSNSPNPEATVTEFAEYEEASAPEGNGISEIDIESDTDFIEPETPSNMPDLGNQKAIKHMEDVARKG